MNDELTAVAAPTATPVPTPSAPVAEASVPAAPATDVAVFNDLMDRGDLPTNLGQAEPQHLLDLVVAILNTPISLGSHPEITFGHVLVLMLAFWIITRLFKIGVLILTSPFRLVGRCVTKP